MKLGKLSLVVGVFAAAICLEPNVGWTTRPSAGMISGQVTSAPGNGEIEIAHHLYHVKPGSAADQALGSIYVGQNVDAVLDGPAGPTGPVAGGTNLEIVILTAHPAS